MVQAREGDENLDEQEAAQVVDERILFGAAMRQRYFREVRKQMLKQKKALRAEQLAKCRDIYCDFFFDNRKHTPRMGSEESQRSAAFQKGSNESKKDSIDEKRSSKHNDSSDNNDSENYIDLRSPMSQFSFNGKMQQRKFDSQQIHLVVNSNQSSLESQESSKQQIEHEDAKRDDSQKLLIFASEHVHPNKNGLLAVEAEQDQPIELQIVEEVREEVKEEDSIQDNKEEESPKELPCIVEEERKEESNKGDDDDGQKLLEVGERKPNVKGSQGMGYAPRFRSFVSSEADGARVQGSLASSQNASKNYSEDEKEIEDEYYKEEEKKSDSEGDQAQDPVQNQELYAGDKDDGPANEGLEAPLVLLDIDKPRSVDLASDNLEVSEEFKPQPPLTVRKHGSLLKKKEDTMKRVTQNLSRPEENSAFYSFTNLEPPQRQQMLRKEQLRLELNLIKAELVLSKDRLANKETTMKKVFEQRQRRWVLKGMIKFDFKEALLKKVLANFARIDSVPNGYLYPELLAQSEVPAELEEAIARGKCDRGCIIPDMAPI